MPEKKREPEIEIDPEELSSFPGSHPNWDIVLTTLYILSMLYTFYLFYTSKLLKGWLSTFGAFLAIEAFILWILKIFFCKIGQYISLHFLNKTPFNNPLKTRIQSKKFEEQGWQFVVHLLGSYYSIFVVMWDEPWWSDPRTMAWPPGDQQIHKDSVIMLYVAEMALWIWMAFTLRWIEARNKDYVTMFTHHICTLMLLNWSLSYGYCRMGVFLVMLHDVTDIPVDICKFHVYLKLEEKAGFYLLEFWFFMMMLVWFIGRLIIYPWKVIWLLFSETEHPQWGIFVHWAGGVGMVLLFILHIYWFYCFILILMSQGEREEGNKSQKKKKFTEAGDKVYFGTEEQIAYEKKLEKKKKKKD